MPSLSRDPTAAYPISEDTSIPPEERTTLWICSYTKFDNLAHAPRGTPSDHSLHTIHLDERTGALHRAERDASSERTLLLRSRARCTATKTVPMERPLLSKERSCGR